MTPLRLVKGTNDGEAGDEEDSYGNLHIPVSYSGDADEEDN